MVSIVLVLVGVLSFAVDTLRCWFGLVWSIGAAFWLDSVAPQVCSADDAVVLQLMCVWRVQEVGRGQQAEDAVAAAAAAYQGASPC